MAISESEAIVMQVLWERAPRTAEDVVAALAHTGWAEPTIKTLLNRLLNKGAVAAHKDGRKYHYAPCCCASTGCSSRAKDCCNGCSAAASRRWWRTSARAANSARPIWRN